MKIARLRGRKTCERVMKRGEVWRGKHMKITFLKSPITPSSPSPLRQGYEGQGLRRAGNHQSPIIVLFVGTVASAKLEKSAVKRNRMRRRCREALRIAAQQLAIGNWQLATQLLLMPRLSSLTCDFQELLQDAEHFLSHLLKH